MNYPTGIKVPTKKNTTYGNRGMTLENDLNETNNYYLVNDIVVIYKKPTPITVVDVDYRSRNDAIIKKAYFKTPSTTDYNGIYKGKYIDFEAKETTSKTSFPLSNIHQHQIEHLKRINNHGGIAFLIIRFTALNLTYILSYYDLESFVLESNKKSIPLEYFEKHGKIIIDKYSPRVDYLSIIDEIYFKGDVLWKQKILERIKKVI